MTKSNTRKSLEMKRANLQKQAGRYWNNVKAKKEIIEQIKQVTLQIKNMSYQSKVYKVVIGFITKDDDVKNYDSATVIAKDVPEAMAKVELKKKEYIQEVVLENWIDL